MSDPKSDAIEWAIEWAWGIIANAHGGNWDEATSEWRQAAEHWRDECLPLIEAEPEDAPEEGDQP